MTQVALTGMQDLVLIITQHTTFFLEPLQNFEGDGGNSPVEQILITSITLAQYLSAEPIVK